MSDIKTIEAYATKPATDGQGSDSSKPAAIDEVLANDLQLTITRIRLREELSSLSGEARQQLIQKNLADPKLAEWIWYRYVKTVERSDSRAEPARQVKVLPLGQNIFPKDVSYYAALPHPAKALDKLGNAIDGLQLDSARSQANFVLVLNFLREQLAAELGSPSGVQPISYSGIDLDQPIALAKWFAEGAPKGIQSAERKAMIVRVTDRARFERVLTRYQQIFGGLSNLGDAFSGVVRFLPVLPAFLPVTAKAVLDGSVKPRKQLPLLTYSFAGATEWNGHSIKILEHRSVDANGYLTSNSAYLTYVDDTAILASSLESIRDVLTGTTEGDSTLAANPDFKQAGNVQAEAIYLSDLRQLLADPTANGELPKEEAVSESGLLRISNSVFENLYELRFKHSDWLKPFKPFQPQELVSPRELLPRATVAYYFMNFDTVAAWRDWSSHLFQPQARKDLVSIWAIDFENEVLPELGPECGAAVLGLPNIFADDPELPWVAFFKLKSNKLARALEAGKLVTGGSTNTGTTQVKLRSGDLFIAAKGGFLVLSNNRAGISALDQKEKLISSRDFSRAAKEAPAELVAFGGYNLEAAVSSIGDSVADEVKTQQSTLISSLANAFHTPNFYATATADAVHGRMSLSMDREGRFSVSELSSLAKEYRLTYAQLEARGVPIQNQERLSSLKLRVKATAAGEIERIKDDISSPHQIATKISENELELNVMPRNSAPKTSVVLPLKDAQFQPYLQPDREIRSDDKRVVEKAREIVGDERDAWNVARKLADWTYKNITWKSVDYATATQTLATLEADCLEFSQLYVAMARSLGLPARIVSGLAHSDGSFGAHAWVEVYAGSWIEVDPTWGTDFVDATHIRNSNNGTLLTYASLNLIDLEVLEARRGVAEFQKDVRMLAEKLCQELPQSNSAALTSALDLGVLTSENPALGAWDSLNDSERDVLSTGYRKVLLFIDNEFSKATTGAEALRLLRIDESAETAEALAIEPGFNQILLKLRFVKRDGAWFLREIVQADTGLHMIAESLQPSITTILERRNSRSAPDQRGSEIIRILVLMQKDAKAALALVERLLGRDPKNQGFRHLKAMTLLRNDRQADAIQLWKELAAEEKPFAPAVFNLAWQHDQEDAEQRKLAIEFYTRYGELEPADPRTQAALARLYDKAEDYVRAEAEHRAALKSDPLNTQQYVEFASFLAIRKRFKEVETILTEAEKKARADDDLFGDLMAQLHFTDDAILPE
ncbi:MAG TPA: transglutaminase domain-containing protein, partial [Pyrinomonadaceae bacterium]|nr:transglutaminase domain-containing protein [Pyrinomonadaceae bacterium]